MSTNIVEIFPETRLWGQDEPVYQILCNLNIEVGAEYIVIIDGVEYRTITSEISQGGVTGVLFGDPAEYGFQLAYIPSYGVMTFKPPFLSSEGYGHTFAIKQIVEAEEPSETISYVEYLANPKYRRFPVKGLIGWILHRDGVSK